MHFTGSSKREPLWKECLFQTTFCPRSVAALSAWLWGSFVKGWKVVHQFHSPYNLQKPSEKNENHGDCRRCISNHRSSSSNYIITCYWEKAFFPRWNPSCAPPYWCWDCSGLETVQLFRRACIHTWTWSIGRSSRIPHQPLPPRYLPSPDMGTATEHDGVWRCIYSPRWDTICSSTHHGQTSGIGSRPLRIYWAVLIQRLKALKAFTWTWVVRNNSLSIGLKSNLQKSYH